MYDRCARPGGFNSPLHRMAMKLRFVYSVSGVSEFYRRGEAVGGRPRGGVHILTSSTRINSTVKGHWQNEWQSRMGCMW